jgi:hypothetical protein
MFIPSSVLKSKPPASKKQRGRYLLFAGHTLPDRFTVFIWTFPSSGILEIRKHDVSETESVSVLR